MERLLLGTAETLEPRSIPVVIALATLSATVALAFGRVFESGRYVAPVLVAALLPHLIGAIVRWRRGRDVIVWLSSFAGLVVYATFVLPGGGSPGALVDRLREGWRVVEHDPVPLRPTDGALLLTVIVVWLVSSLADDLALERRASLGAVAPGLTVLIWVMALGTEDGQWRSAIAFGAAATLFLAVQHQILLEHRRTRIGARRVLDAPGLLAAGVTIGVAAMVLGMAAAPALPGGDEPLFESGRGNDPGNDSYRTRVAPFLDVAENLERTENRELFTVRASEGQYWRLVALEEYTVDEGGQWTLRASGEDQVGEGLDASVPAGALTQQVEIGPLGERWIPAAYEPVEVSLEDVLVVRSSSTLVNAEEVSGLRYEVVSALPDLELTPEQVEATAGPVPPELRRFTDLPPTYPAELREIAEQVTAGGATPFEKGFLLRNFFRDESLFTYDANATPTDSGDALLEFVTGTRRGFCVQFASAYATMARALGIPARVAVGFTPGKKVGGVFHVASWDAHAWPEIWLAGVGWTHPFDPTPPVESTGGRGGSDLSDEIAPPPPTSVTTTTVTTSVPSSTPVPSTVPTPTPTEAGGGVTVDRSPARSGADDGSALVVIAIVLAAIAVLASPIAAVLWLKARRRARRREDPDAATAVSGAWAQAIDELSDRKVAWPASDTPRELAARVPTVAGAATATPMRALAESYGAIRYGRARPSPSEVDEAWEHVDTLRRALDGWTGLAGRIRARLDPGTLRRRDRELVRQGAGGVPHSTPPADD